MLTEAAPSWRRFLITSVEKDELASERTLLLDVAVLGRDARADRVQHRLDRAMVDSLVARVSLNKDDVRTAATLYDQLIPHELRSAFQTTAGVQFIVDPTTANYPWELLGAPRPSDRRQAGGSFGGAMRQFTESEDRRLNPERASFGSALVIAAANVPGENELPGVLEEADVVSQLLDERAARNAHAARRSSPRDRPGPRPERAVRRPPGLAHRQPRHLHRGSARRDRGDPVVRLPAHRRHRAPAALRARRRVPQLLQSRAHRHEPARCRAGTRVHGDRRARPRRRGMADRGCRRSGVRRDVLHRVDRGPDARRHGDRARNHAADLGGRETWAAYQCYGDPGFVLRGARATLSAAVTEPVSLSDLMARLDSLAVNTSDLGRPGRGGVQDRRRRMVAIVAGARRLDRRRPSVAADNSIQRKLAAVARDLGEYRTAADRYRRFVIDDSSGTPVVGATSRATSIGDVQQTANCLARAAQKAVRDSGAANDAPLADTLRADLDLAIELARTAVDLLAGPREPRRARKRLQAGGHRRSATPNGIPHRGDHELPPRRRAEQGHPLRRRERAATGVARRATRAASGRTPNSSNASCREHLRWRRPTRRARRVDQRRADAVDFWTKADAGDRALTRLIAADDGQRDARRRPSDLVAAYQRAFASRSTWAQRQSPLDHLRDLASLLDAADPRLPYLQRACDELVQWEDVHVEETVEEPDSST